MADAASRATPEASSSSSTTKEPLSSPALVATLPGHTDRAWHVSWNPATPLLASCSSDKSIRMHNFIPSLSSDRIDYAFHHQSTIPTSHSRTVRSLAFNPTGATLATASFDSTVGIWQQVAEAGLDDGAAGGEGEWEALDPLEGHESECKGVEWSFDGRLIASCSRDKSVWIWEGASSARCSFGRLLKRDIVQSSDRQNSNVWQF